MSPRHLLEAPPLLATVPRRVVMLAFADVQMLDVTGPLEVFAMATRLLAMQGAQDPGYVIELVATKAGPVVSSSGVALNAHRAWRGLRGAIDTLMVPGGLGTEAVARNPALIRWLTKTEARARRLASVCTGALLLAEAGLLDGKRATTHWAYAEHLAQRFPKVAVEPDPIFIRDGRIYTSAGITAGMDLALALVEEIGSEEAEASVCPQNRAYGSVHGSSRKAYPTMELKPVR
jgi:transcriptional regulator GlxA family with amidase domain